MSPRKKTTNNLHPALLGFFLKNPNYGYDLYKQIGTNSSFMKIWHIKQSQFYAILENFYQEAFLEIRVFEGENYPDRKEYYLTDKGRSFVESWMITSVNHGRDMRQEFLAKLYFALQTSKETAIKLIKNQITECNLWLIQFANEETQDGELQDGQLSFAELMNDYRLIQIKGMVDWLHDVESKIRAKN